MRNFLMAFMGLALVACDDGGTAADPRQEGTLDQGADAALQADAGTPDAGTPDAAAPDAEAPPPPDAGAPDGALPDEGVPVPTGQCGAGDVTGWLYLDEEHPDETARAADRAPTDPPVTEPFVVQTPMGEEAVTPCDDGSYAISDLPEGPALVVPPTLEGQRCTGRNCTHSFAAAVASGHAVMVVLGDSIPVIGDRPLFPDRLVTLFDGLVDIENRNVAVAGSTSPQWLPGQRNFDQRLAPVMADADLIIISIGGNDILEYISNPALLANIPAAVEGAKALVATIVERVVTIVQAIRAVNPGVDVVYCLYPDYTQATTHQLWGLAGRLLGAGTMRDVLETALLAVPETADSDILIADMLHGWEGLDVGLLLYDTLHFNAAGQTLYAEEIFETLGGVRFGPSPFGELGHTPLGDHHDYGYAPLP